MNAALWIALSLILAEVGFIVSFLLSFILLKSVLLVLSIIIKRRMDFQVIPLLLGLFAGCSAGFSTLSILFLIRRYAGLEENWYMVVSILIVFYGQVQYFGQSLNAVTSGTASVLGWPGRLNGLMFSPIQRAQFEYYQEILRQQRPDQVEAEGNPIGYQAYEWLKKYMLSVALSSLIGIILGLFFYYWIVFL
jgi:hypothetical protein